MLTFGSLFAGIGGIDLGLERAGMVCQWQVEIDSFCRKVLAKHWPDIPRFEDIRDCGVHNLSPVDLIAGGFPCQDVSVAGKRAGIEGEKSGLWTHFARIISELHPKYALLENVPGLLFRHNGGKPGAARVLGDLAEMGYDAEWGVIPASSFGLAHKRERVFIVAYNCSQRGLLQPFFSASSLQEVLSEAQRPQKANHVFSKTVRGASGRVWLVPNSELRGSLDGVPNGLDRIRALGNAVVPQAAELIGGLIIRDHLRTSTED